MGALVEELEPAFLPDFCRVRSIVLVILMAELLAFILALSSIESWQYFLLKLALISVFIQWVALINIVVLCLGRAWLRALTPLSAALSSSGLNLVITLLVSVITLWIAPVDTTGHFGENYSESIFILRNLTVSAIISAVALRYFYVQHQWKSNIEAEARFRIQALQARIRPHFLFNSMNTIASLTRTNPQLAEKAVEDLADLFRASLGQRDKVKLSEELEFTREYINIEQLRMGERLCVEWQIDENVPSNTLVPSLILQPLVENSIYHGIEPQTSGGVVNVSIMRRNGFVIFTINNPLPQTIPPYRRKGNNMALDNIRQRLKLAYGDKSVMDLRKNDGKYVVSITLPIEELP